MGQIHTDQALCIDLELTCWDGPPPDGMRRELIEIGIVEADMRTLTITREASFLVRPQMSEISDFCAALTGISRSRMATTGKPFNEAINTVRNAYGPARKALVTWGDDWGAIERECVHHRVANPFPQAGVVNIGQTAALLAGQGRGVGLYDTMAAFGVAETGQRHRGLDDARNTMRLFLFLAERYRAAMPS